MPFQLIFPHFRIIWRPLSNLGRLFLQVFLYAVASGSGSSLTLFTPPSHFCFPNLSKLRLKYSHKHFLPSHPHFFSKDQIGSFSVALAFYSDGSAPPLRDVIWLTRILWLDPECLVLLCNILGSWQNLNSKPSARFEWGFLCSLLILTFLSSDTERLLLS